MSEIKKPSTKSNDNVLSQEPKLRQIVATLLQQSQEQGASSAEVSASVEDGFTVAVRMAEVDTIEYQRDKGISVTVYFGQSQGSASTSDTSEDALKQTVIAACDIARYTSDDPCAGLADKELMAFDYPDLDQYHPWDLSTEQAIDLAKRCEAKGLAYDKRIVNSEGASVTTHRGIHAYGNSHGFVGVIPASYHSLSCSLLAQDNQGMQRDYYYTAKRDPALLVAANKIGEEAALRTVRRLGGQRLSTRKAPVIFAANIARSLFGNFLAAISGGNLYRESSFLLNSLGKAVFPEWLTISENPYLKGAMNSSPYDGEGVRTQEKNLIEQGVLQSYILSSYSARKLGLKTTGNAGGVYNLLVNGVGDRKGAGKGKGQSKGQSKDQNHAIDSISFKKLLAQMGTGLLVTEVMGHGTNIVTGDYSLGAFGFWIEKGEIVYPVEEITIASNLKTMFQQIEAIADDVDRRGNIHCGSVLISEMMIAGK